MHPCLKVYDILLQIFSQLEVTSLDQPDFLENRITLAGLATCCRDFEYPALESLWSFQTSLRPLIGCIPQDLWENGGFHSLVRVVAKLE